MSEWLAMGGYAFFVWGSYGVTFAAIVLELCALRRRRGRAFDIVRAQAEGGR